MMLDRRCLLPGEEGVEKGVVGNSTFMAAGHLPISFTLATDRLPSPWPALLPMLGIRGSAMGAYLCISCTCLPCMRACLACGAGAPWELPPRFLAGPPASARPNPLRPSSSSRPSNPSNRAGFVAVAVRPTDELSTPALPAHPPGSISFKQCSKRGSRAEQRPNFEPNESIVALIHFWCQASAGIWSTQRAQPVRALRGDRERWVVQISDVSFMIFSSGLRRSGRTRKAPATSGASSAPAHPLVL